MRLVHVFDGPASRFHAGDSDFEYWITYHPVNFPVSPSSPGDVQLNVSVPAVGPGSTAKSVTGPGGIAADTPVASFDIPEWIPDSSTLHITTWYVAPSVKPVNVVVRDVSGDTFSANTVSVFAYAGVTVRFHAVPATVEYWITYRPVRFPELPSSPGDVQRTTNSPAAAPASAAKSFTAAGATTVAATPAG
jgi:hypothetical protein